MTLINILEWTQSLGNSIKIQTISWNDTNQNDEELENLQAFLLETFPKVFGSPEIVKVEERTIPLLIVSLNSR